MLILGLLWVFLLEEAFCFVQSDVVLAPQVYCSDVSESNCSLLNCSFVDEARKLCPKKCGYCQSLQEDMFSMFCSVCDRNPLVVQLKGVCEDTEDDCSTLINICNADHILPIAADVCPKSCKFCEPCVDTNNTVCPGLKKYCDTNENVAKTCPKSCDRCKVYNATHIIEIHKTSTMKTRITTATTFTTAPSASTKSPTAIASRNCDKFGVIVSVAKGSIVSYAGTPPCPDGVHQPSESLIQKYCGAPNISDWAQGEKVMTNCQNVPHYTAIAAVKFGGATVAGVFIKCEIEGFQAAIQLCDSEMKLYHISMSSTSNLPSADRFVVIDWK